MAGLGERGWLGLPPSVGVTSVPPLWFQNRSLCLLLSQRESGWPGPSASQESKNRCARSAKVAGWLRCKASGLHLHRRTRVWNADCLALGGGDQQRPGFVYKFPCCCIL